MCFAKLTASHLVSNHGQNSKEAAAGKPIHLLLEADNPAAQAQLAGSRQVVQYFAELVLEFKADC